MPTQLQLTNILISISTDRLTGRLCAIKLDTLLHVSAVLSHPQAVYMFCVHIQGDSGGKLIFWEVIVSGIVRNN